jgi:hypothetical protein
MSPPEIQMLSLDSPRWKSFSTYFGSPEQVPQRLASWRESIGGPDEDLQWSELWEQFLHQFTITDAAYAAVPHVVGDLDRVAPRKRFDYLVELALIEGARQSAGAPELASDLAHPYYTAMAKARHLAVECLSLELPKIEFRYLLSILASLHGHGVLGDLIFHLDCLCGECPKCGEFVYPDEIQGSGYAR